MTTRPTDEQIRAVRDYMKGIGKNQVVDLFDAWFAERQSEKDELTDDVIANIQAIIVEHPDNKECYPSFDSIRAALQSIAKPVRDGVTDEKEDLDPVKLHREGRSASEWERGFNEGWNECREIMLSTPPHPQQAVPDGWKLVPEKFCIDRQTWECLQYAFGGPGTDENEPYLDCTAWVGELDEDDGSKSYGIHLSCDECPEEGSVTIAKFSVAPAYNGKKDG